MAGEACSAVAAPFFSVIMNVYNGERFLHESIGSVLAQTIGDWELICWDDCSSDASGRICREFGDPRIRYVLAEAHCDVSRAREAAIALARGTWLAFLDQDDVWSATKLANQLALIHANDGHRLGLVYGRTMVRGELGRERDFDRWHEFGPLPEGNVYKELLQRPSFIALSSAAMKRAVVVSGGAIPMDVRYCPDYYLFLRVARTHSAAAVQTTCCWYRLHDANMSHRYLPEIHIEILRIIEMFGADMDPRTLKRRRQIHLSLIGLHDMKTRGCRRRGLSTILRKGSIVYLLLRPCLHAYRRLRRIIYSA